MGRAIVKFDKFAAKNRARTRKYRFLKKMQIENENRVRDRIYSIKQARFEQIFSSIDQEEEKEEEGEKTQKDDDANKMIEFSDKLRFWAMHHRITHSAISDLLAILIFGGFLFLPRNSRTFMRTPKKVMIRTLTIGKMWYYGVQRCLENALSTGQWSTKLHSISSLKLDFSFDGLPIFKSSNISFWPILFSIQEFPEIPPMVSGIWSGESKPILNEYIEPLVNELKILIAEGIPVNAHRIGIEIGRILADTPARAFLKGVVNFNHKHGCQKCEVTGVTQNHRMSFVNLECNRRTNESFRCRTQNDHHKEHSLMEDLNIDMIKSFPIADNLHLLDLGVMRKCLYRWVFGMKGYDRKWSKHVFEQASELLEKCAPYMPSDIHRTIRGLNCLKRWKGIEYRTVLLYAGISVLKQVLPENEYHHFLILFCAVTICSCKVYKASIPLAGKLFEIYVKMYSEIYGTDTISSNVHNLIHIVEDMNNLQIANLMDISTYKYENCLRLLGLKVKQCHLPLEQAARRVIEMAQIKQGTVNTNRNCIYAVNIPRSNKFSPLVYYKKNLENRVTYDKIEIKHDVMLSNRRLGDSWFLARAPDGIRVVKMVYVAMDANEYKIWGSPLKQQQSFFTHPITSTKLNIYASDGEKDEPMFWSIDSIIAKMICFPCGEQFVYVPILHTLESLKL